jgi:PTH1 family peptidyl-tRNA hydrolase
MSFMNRCVYPLLAVAQFYKIEPQQILVILDDLALPVGRLRLRARGGSGGHNGLESIIMQFGTEEIPRLRIGIGEAPREGSVDYVLNRFFDEEKPLVRSTINRAVEAVKCAIYKGLVSAMNTFNKTQLKKHEPPLRSPATLNRAKKTPPGKLLIRLNRVSKKKELRSNRCKWISVTFAVAGASIPDIM